MDLEEFRWHQFTWRTPPSSDICVLLPYMTQCKHRTVFSNCNISQSTWWRVNASETKWGFFCAPSCVRCQPIHFAHISFYLEMSSFIVYLYYNFSTSAITVTHIMYLMLLSNLRCLLCSISNHITQKVILLFNFLLTVLFDVFTQTSQCVFCIALIFLNPQ